MIMSWIYGMIFILIQISSKSVIRNQHVAYATPLQSVHVPSQINTFIRHWEPAHFNRDALEQAHRAHESNRRRKREINYNHFSPHYGSTNVIKFNFNAHDREFRIEMREDPTSVFSSDIVIESTDGPLDYDISRVYSGKLENDENSHVHGVLTADNLFDGTITTGTEQYYIEPSDKYSEELGKNGVHTIIYKLSDVKMDVHKHNTDKSDHETHCASEKLYRKMQEGDSDENDKNFLYNHYKVNEKSDNNNPYNNKFKLSNHYDNGHDDDGDEDIISRSSGGNNQGNADTAHKRMKRWLKSRDRHEPPLPLDLETPYNTRLNINVNSENNNEDDDDDDDDQYQSDQAPSPTIATSNNNHRNILISSYNPNSDYNLRNIITKTNRNVLSSVFSDGTNRINNNFTATNQQMNVNSRPNHKTHVELITKNGPTKKPNIIFNNYNPDLIYANNNPPQNNNKHHPNNNQYPHHNVNSNIKNDMILDMINTKSATSGSLADRKSTCMLYLQADHTFFQKLGSDEASIEAITRHVQRANVIYKNTDFNSDGKPDNITFMIKRIKIHNSNALKDPGYRFPGNYGVEKFLELFSEEDYDQFCLAYMFTYRDFEMGTLGLAWTGDLKNAGGVCEKNGHYRGSLKSLNTGIVTLLNYGKHVPPAVSHVTLAHEIGHNFGSPHDPDQCTPGGEDGNFIMFARATSGDKRNNNKFSPCSLKAIEPVLNAKARSSKGCFTEPTQSICGNGVVEPGEQCDCGWEEDCKDDCCYPMNRHPAYNERPCTLRPDKVCSPSQGPCCTSKCSLKYGDKCRDDNGCREPSYCDGRSAICPPSVNKPNKTICNKEFVCYMGECTGSICLAYGLESCQCIPGENDPKTKSCELCCKKPGENQECKSSFEWNKAPYDVPDMYSKPGTPCNEYNGYCDVFQRCREVDPSGPLATLRKLLLSEESIASFKKWVISNWYAVSLIIVAVFALLLRRFLKKWDSGNDSNDNVSQHHDNGNDNNEDGKKYGDFKEKREISKVKQRNGKGWILSTRFLGKKSNLKLKTVTIIHSATTETVRLPDDNNGVIVHTAVRTKVPLKKKVRGERSKKKSQQKVIIPQILPQKDVIPSNVTSNAVNPTLPVSATSIKPLSRSQKKSLESPKKLLRKKKKHRQVSGPDDNSGQMKVKDEQQQQQQQQQLPTKPQRKPKKKPSSSSSKHKEIIDYSNPESHTNTFGKVQKWLLESPIVLSAASQIEHASKISNMMNKSHSTPEHLASVQQPQQQQQQQQRSPINTAKPKGTTTAAKSTNNLNDKVRLQVVYKPPFKFSLKFSKNKNNVKTNVVGADKNKMLWRQQHQQQQQQQQRNSLEDPSRSRRAALLIRSATEDISNQLVQSVDEPLYETLSHPPKVKQQPQPNYENLPTTSSTANLIDASMNNSISSPINTATFRVNKSASGSNINNHRNLPVISTPILNSKNSRSHQRGSQNNLRRSSIGNSGSSSNLMKFGGSSQNLTRSSTTNLTKHSQRDGIKRRASDMNRSSTTNLNKYNRHNSSSSNSNLRRGGSNMDVNSSPSSEEYNPVSSNERKSHSRKSSMNVSNSKLNQLSKTYSNSNLVNNSNNTCSSNGSTAICPVQGSSRRESFNNNIPRASLINSITNISNPFQRQTSLKPTQPLSHSSRMMIDELNKNRPQTSSCDSSMFKNFEWPKVLTTQRSLPADNAGQQSDLEVMVSDVENLMNDS